MIKESYYYYKRPSLEVAPTTLRLVLLIVPRPMVGNIKQYCDPSLRPSVCLSVCLYVCMYVYLVPLSSSKRCILGPSLL